MVTAAPTVVPDALLDQLANKGRMLIPVGESRSQKLLMFRRSDGEIEQTNLEPVKFVPLMGGKS